jgi:hypothetical protein
MKMRLLLFLGLLVGSIGLSLLSSPATYAVGETYKWIDATTIEGSGGSYSSTSGVVKTGNAGPSRPEPAGTVRFTRDGTTKTFKAPTDLYTGSASGGGGTSFSTKCDLQLSITVSALNGGAISTNDPGKNTCTQSNLTPALTIGDTDKGPTAEDLGVGATVPTGPGAGATTGEAPKSCGIDGIGWILCPVLKFMAGIIDGAYAFVGSLLVVSPIISDDGPAKTSIYGAWSVMRNFANVAFVIAFMIIIFSQLTSFGLNNYGIKKMLPRLIVAAILVNVSFWICAIAVDISNILGASLNGLFDAIPATGDGAKAQPGFDLNDPAVTGDGWQGIVGFVLAGGIVTGIALYVTLSALLPALLAALVAIATVFIVLTIRQALIILLIVVSPLAFVAYLLPNTESLYKKWLGLFKTLLLMFPIIAVIFGASSLASTIVMNGAEGPYKMAIQIMGALIAIVPLALTPIVMKTAGGLLNRIGGVVNNPNKGPVDKIRKKAEGYRDFRQGLARGRRIDRARNFREGKTFNGAIGKTLFGEAGSDDRKVTSRLFGGAYEANQRDRSRKDRLSTYESAAEQAYNESTEGQRYATEAIQAKNRAGTASTNISALAAETTERTDLTAAQSAKDRQGIAQNTNDTFSEASRDMGTRIEQALAKSNLAMVQKFGEARVEDMKADDAVVPADLAITVQALRDADLEANVAAGQIDSAKRLQTQQYHEAVRNDPALASRVGGRDPHGESRAVANAMDAEARTSREAISAEKTTMRDMQIPDLEAQANDTGNSLERRLAASSMKNVVSNPKDILTTMDNLSAKLQIASASGNQQEIVVAKEMQQQFMEDVGGKLSMAISGQTKGQLAAGTFTGSVADDIVETFNSGGFSGEKFASMHYGELGIVNKALDTNKTRLDASRAANLKRSIEQFNAAAASLGKGPAENIAKPMEDIASRL